MTKIEVFCGFLESGKTTLIQRVLEQSYMRAYRRILILQCEEGFSEFRASKMENKNVILSQIKDVHKIRTELFEKIEDQVDPDLVLIEFNGTWPIEQLLQTKLPEEYKIDRILFCADAATFDLYMNNTGALMRDQLSNADSVHFNRCNSDLKPLETAAGNINRTAKLYFDEPGTDRYLATVFDQEEVSRIRGVRRRNIVAGTLIFAALCFVAAGLFSSAKLFPTIQSINMIFIGIAMQAIPFLLIGSFVSSLLQVYVPDDVLVRFFTKHKWLGFPLAALLGFFFPICDCGIVPIASRLTQKGVPLSHAIVFMLAAPAVSPITILSTAYAFPGQPSYVYLRILIGVLIAVLVGGVLNLTRVKAEDVLLSGSTASCACSVDTVPYRSRLEQIFVLTGREFISMGKYIIVGSLLCAILQQVIPSSLFQHKGAPVIFPILLMLMLAFFMSVCSSANAFIGRSFSNVLPVAPVLAFVVMGPMLDLSNLFLLTGTFKKSFVIKLAVLLLLIAVPVFLLLSVLI
jgi:Predicted permeases